MHLLKQHNFIWESMLCYFFFFYVEKLGLQIDMKDGNWMGCVNVNVNVKILKPGHQGRLNIFHNETNLQLWALLALLGSYLLRQDAPS